MSSLARRVPTKVPSGSDPTSISWSSPNPRSRKRASGASFRSRRSSTVHENLELALWGDKSFRRLLFARLTRSERLHIDDVLDAIGLTEQRAGLAGALSHGEKQWLEIGMLLMQEPELLLIDEPVAGMTPQETERTALLLRALSAEHSLIVVEHDMDFVRSIARRVTVLHEGRVLADGDMDQVQDDPRVVEVYLGA